MDRRGEIRHLIDAKSRTFEACEHDDSVAAGDELAGHSETAKRGLQRGPLPRRRLKAPAEVDLGADDPVPVEGENLGVPASASVASRHLVGDDHLVTSLNESYEIKLLSLPRAWPATLEIATAVQANIDRAPECELACQYPLDEFAVTGREGGVRTASARRPISRTCPATASAPLTSAR